MDFGLSQAFSPLRAIGDFKYVGFFQENKNNEIWKNDTEIFFSPLCFDNWNTSITLELTK
ncbi:MAG: DUF3995 domain-containing protein [Cytophagaceae bacterium]|nr:DUF3995 domain-containing protein [Cytophagaceae bacterium]